jgi:hypothetical protein
VERGGIVSRHTHEFGREGGSWHGPQELHGVYAYGVCEAAGELAAR